MEPACPYAGLAGSPDPGGCDRVPQTRIERFDAPSQEPPLRTSLNQDATPDASRSGDAACWIHVDRA